MFQTRHYQFKKRVVYVDDDSDSESGSSDEELEYIRPQFETPPQYWFIQKLVKYIRNGDEAVTLISLCCLLDHDLSREIHKFAIQDCGGLELFINILETDHIECKICTLRILLDLVKSRSIQKVLVNLGCVAVMVRNMSTPCHDIKILIGEIMFYLGRLRKVRIGARRHGGIYLFVYYLSVKEKLLDIPYEELSQDDQHAILLAGASLRALWSLSKSKKNVKLMMRYGCVPVIHKLLSSVHTRVVISTLGVLSQCVLLPEFKYSIHERQMTKYIVSHLSKANGSVQRYCCETIMGVAEYEETRHLIRRVGGLPPLVEIINDQEKRKDKNLLASVTGVIWKTSLSPENVRVYDKLGTLNVLVELLKCPDEDERVLSNVVGALREFLKQSHNKVALRKTNGIKYLVNLLNYTYVPLLENLPLALEECTEDPELMESMEREHGIRLIWSLLKNKSSNVQANAAMCLVPCIRKAQNVSDMVFSFIGGLELVINVLHSKDLRVLRCICALVAEIAKDNENLAVLSDSGVVKRLVDLLKTKDRVLRQNLCLAIAFCCSWGPNNKLFGRLGAVVKIVGYLMDEDDEHINESAAVALCHLADNYFNCVTMHESGVVPHLLKFVRSKNHVLQAAAAGCIAKMRNLALLAEDVHLFKRNILDDEETDMKRSFC